MKGNHDSRPGLMESQVAGESDRVAGSEGGWGDVGEGRSDGPDGEGSKVCDWRRRLYIGMQREKYGREGSEVTMGLHTRQLSCCRGVNENCTYIQT